MNELYFGIEIIVHLISSMFFSSIPPFTQRNCALKWMISNKSSEYSIETSST